MEKIFHSSRFCLYFFAAVMVALSFGCEKYEVEQNSVYYKTWDEGHGSRRTKIIGADAATFKVLKHDRYAKDKSQVYFNGGVITGADAQSFKTIGEVSAVDRYHAYCMNRPIPGADSNTYRAIDVSWGCDQSDCYHMGTQLHACNPSSFRVYAKNVSYAYDNQCAYYQQWKLPLRDRQSLKILDSGYVKDNKGVYFLDTVVEEADPQTFTVKPHTFIVYDKNGYFYRGKRDDKK